jgi:hypothetical protein
LSTICFVGRHKIKGKEMPSRSHNDLHITDHNIGLTKSFSASSELHRNLKFGVLNFLLIYLFIFFTMLSHKSVNKRTFCNPVVLHLVLSIYYITFSDLCMLNHLYIAGMKLTLL